MPLVQSLISTFVLADAAAFAAVLYYAIVSHCLSGDLSVADYSVLADSPFLALRFPYQRRRCVGIVALVLELQTDVRHSLNWEGQQSGLTCPNQPAEDLKLLRSVLSLAKAMFPTLGMIAVR